MRAAEVTNMRGGRFMSVEDIIFLMRKDKVREYNHSLFPWGDLYIKLRLVIIVNFNGNPKMVPGTCFVGVAHINFYP